MGYNPKIYRTEGGDTQIIASGGEQKVESGGKISVESGGTLEVDSGGIVTMASGAIQTGVVQNLRTRTAKAGVIAGVTLLPAIAGYSYRLINVDMISTEANAATATSVDINGNQSGAVILVANAVAGLTDSAVLKMGATNSAVLADGASYSACTANTAITMKQITAGGDLSGTVNLDTIITYVVEAA